MTKQTLYEKIRTVVEAGQIAITQNRSGWVRLRSSMCEFWDIRCSYYQETIEKCYLTLWQNYTTQQWLGDNQEDWERYIWIYERPLWRPKQGDEVTLLKKAEEVKEMYGKTKDEYRYKDFIGKKCEVHLLGDYFCQIRIPSEWLFRVPYDCIAPLVPIDE